MSDLTLGLDWVAVALTVGGLYRLPDEALLGWGLLTIGSASWIMWALATGAPLSILTINVMLLVMNARGFAKVFSKRA